MKAILHTRYGPPELLRLAEVDKPVPGDKEILVKIHATTVSTGDCNIRNFTFVTPIFLPLAKVMFGIRGPRNNILGTELSGEIEAVGSGVGCFKPGDAVFGSTGTSLGGHAQYACLREDAALAIKPNNLSWEEAVAIPFGANTALYFLRDLANIQAGQRVLVVGASGSVGSAAVQLARHYGANVTGVCSGANADLVRSLGAGKVIDYTRDDFTKGETAYDFIFDTVGKTSISYCKNSLKPDGVYLACLMGLEEILQIVWTSVVGGRRVKGGVALVTAGNIACLKELMEAGTLKPVIGRRYPLEQTAEAFKYVEQGHKTGSAVITVGHSD